MNIITSKQEYRNIKHIEILKRLSYLFFTSDSLSFYTSVTHAQKGVPILSLLSICVT